MTKLIVILGPTGSGKTVMGIRLAEKFNGEIINADSRQVYRELNIGTAKPSPEILKAVPHHLFDVVTLHDSWNAALFSKKADEAINEISKRNHQVFVVGGTGLHIKALLFGLFRGPEAQKEMRQSLEARIQKEGLGSLYQELKKVDPVAARNIHPNDPIRIVRALEVHHLTGKPISAYQEEHRFRVPRYPYLKIGLQVDRALLHQRIEQRVDEMIQQGLEEEVKVLLEKWGEYPLLQKAIGYKEWLPYFKGQRSKEEVIAEIKKNTRQFAKRQMTWFRKEKDIQWMHPDDSAAIEERINDFLL